MPPCARVKDYYSEELRRWASHRGSRRNVSGGGTACVHAQSGREKIAEGARVEGESHARLSSTCGKLVECELDYSKANHLRDKMKFSERYPRQRAEYGDTLTCGFFFLSSSPFVSTFDNAVSERWRGFGRIPRNEGLSFALEFISPADIFSDNSSLFI